MCVEKNRPLRIHKFENPQSFVLIQVDSREGKTAYDFRAVDEYDRPAAFSIWVENYQVYNVSVVKPVPPTTIISALRYVQKNEIAREDLAHVERAAEPKLAQQAPA